MSLSHYCSEYADARMGLSFDWFGAREDYSAHIDMNEVVESMLPRPRPAPAEDLVEKRNLRAKLLILQATTKHYTLQRAVPKIRGSQHQIQQRRNQYLNRALLALDVIERSTLEPPIIIPDTRGTDCIVVLQKMAFSWFCASMATYTRNHLSDELPNNVVWKAISYLGQIS